MLTSRTRWPHPSGSHRIGRCLFSTLAPVCLALGLILLSAVGVAWATPDVSQAGGKVSVWVGSGSHDETRWFTPGAGQRESFRDCPNCPEMVVVPAGSFMMGSPEGEAERNEDETPHKITIKQPFAAGKYAVTFAEWDACVVDGGCDGYKPADNGWGRGERPVINVSWHDARRYVTWLSAKTGKRYRLLSEAEREYVTRAGTATPFWWGRSISPDQANFDAGAYKGERKKGAEREQTMPVNAFKPNPWGLYQVHGNVWEWCEDVWHDSYDGAPNDGSAWVTGSDSFRVARGGCAITLPRGLRSAARNRYVSSSWSTHDFRMDCGGFRVARMLF